LSGPGVSIFFPLLDRECRQRPRPFSMSIFEFWEVGWECGRSLSRFFFFTGFFLGAKEDLEDLSAYAGGVAE
jgi:hypothetical protein